MCGIAGIRRFDGAYVDISVLRAMTSRLQHRGPDDEGFWSKGSIGFGHRRLSIIDLAGSNQPMASTDGLCHVTFNGEILNYRSLRQRFAYPYQTDGDTETILASYLAGGEAGISELEGQFAFGLHDRRNGSLLLVRDRMGILPLYYYVDATLLAFASEIKALLPAIPAAKLDTRSLDFYLTQRAVQAPYTLFEGVRKLPPAHVLRVGDRGIEQPRRYWSFPEVQHAATTPQDAVARLSSTLRDAVGTALVADVPVGAYLSGGVDSSLIVALMSELRNGTGVKTFSAGFGDPRNDELPYARQVSELLGTEHHEVSVAPDDFRDLWHKLTWHRDAPISEPADIAVFRLAEFARRSVKVVLSGEGSDELFGGYPKHRYARVTAAAGGIPAGLRCPVLDFLEQRLPPSLPRLRIALRALSGPTESDRFRTWFAPFTASERRSLLGQLEQHSFGDWVQQAHGDALRRMLMMDAQTWLTDNLLERGDRMSMAASLELRPPFLDRQVVEFAFSLPSSLKLRHGTTKWLVKQVAQRYLPDKIVNRRKVGFRVPLDTWFRGGLEAFAWDMLTSQGSLAGKLFARESICELLQRHRSGRSNEEIRIWTLLCLEIWNEQFFGNNVGSQSARSTVATLNTVCPTAT
jgi:asparagine synthase (glutamine-hydrolysing)